MSDLGVRIVKAADDLTGSRSTWDEHWQDAADYIMPRKNNITVTQAPGERKTIHVYDTTAGQSASKLASALYSSFTPPNDRWFSLEHEDEDFRDNPAVEEWMAESTDIIWKLIFGSNFNLEIIETFLDVAVFGTACLLLDEGKNSPLNFRAYPVGSFSITEDEEGNPDAVYREFKMTPLQARDEFGIDALSDKLREKLAGMKDGDQSQDKIKIIHAVYRRNDRDESKLDAENMEWASVYVEYDSKHVIREGGFNERPYMTPRAAKSPGEIYGRSPGTAVLPDVQMLNRMEKTSIIQIEKEVNPPLLVPDQSATSHGFKNTPGAINYWDTTSGANKPEPFHVNSRLQFGEEKMEQKRQGIRAAFFNDMFDALGDRKNMTATEVIQRVKEKLIAFLPLAGRLQTELLNPLINRATAIAFRNGLLPEPPDEVLINPNFNIVYNNKITLLMKFIDTEGFNQAMDNIVPFAEAKPEILDNLDFDKMTRGIYKTFSAPLEYLKSEKEVEEERQQRADQQALALAAQAQAEGQLPQQ